MQLHHHIARNATPKGPFLMTRSGLSAAFYREGVPPQPVVHAAQALYEEGYISYPYAECGFLPASAAVGIDMTLQEIGEHIALDDVPIGNPGADVFVENFIWAHHGIVPLVDCAEPRRPMAELHPLAERVYACIAKAYVQAVTE